MDDVRATVTRAAGSGGGDERTTRGATFAVAGAGGATDTGRGAGTDAEHGLGAEEGGALPSLRPSTAGAAMSFARETGAGEVESPARASGRGGADVDRDLGTSRGAVAAGRGLLTGVAVG